MGNLRHIKTAQHQRRARICTLLFPNPLLLQTTNGRLLADDAAHEVHTLCGEHRTESKKLSNTCLVGLLYQPGMTARKPLKGYFGNGDVQLFANEETGVPCDRLL